MPAVLAGVYRLARRARHPRRGISSDPSRRNAPSRHRGLCFCRDRLACGRGTETSRVCTPYPCHRSRRGDRVVATAAIAVVVAAAAIAVVVAAAAIAVVVATAAIVAIAVASVSPTAIVPSAAAAIVPSTPTTIIVVASRSVASIAVPAAVSLIRSTARSSAESPREPTGNRATPLGVHEHALALDPSPVRGPVRRLEVVLARELDEGVPPGISLLILHHAHRSHVAEPLKLPSKRSLVDVFAETSDEEGAIGVADGVGIGFRVVRLRSLRVGGGAGGGALLLDACTPRAAGASAGADGGGSSLGSENSETRCATPVMRWVILDLAGRGMYSMGSRGLK